MVKLLAKLNCGAYWKNLRKALIFIEKKLDITSVIIGIIAGGLIGALISLLLANKRYHTAKQEAIAAQKDAQSWEAQYGILKEEARQNVEKLQSLRVLHAEREAEFRALEKRLQEQKAEVIDIQKRFTEQFDNLANRIFDEKTDKFKKQSEESIGNLLNPIRERLKDFSDKVEKANKDSLEGNAALFNQLKNLKELNQQMTDEAKNLTRALKGEQKTQGNWGEMILERLLEKSGLSKDREYTVQESITTEDGRRLQPDVVIHLPEEKKLIIDSKVSLVAYERWTSEEDESLRPGWMKQHIASIKAHVKGLSDKNYAGLMLGEGKLDFVLLFIPIEPAFSLALQYDSELFTDAYSRNIVLVSPTTLLATLRTIASIWRQEYQNQNAKEIARQGADLHDKLVAFTDDLLKIGDRIKQTQESYDTAMNKLQDGRGSLISRAKRMEKLGLETKKSFSEKMLGKGQEEEED
jgi:DNA recombination protein RmuC